MNFKKFIVDSFIFEKMFKVKVLCLIKDEIIEITNKEILSDSQENIDNLSCVTQESSIGRKKTIDNCEKKFVGQEIWVKILDIFDRKVRDEKLIEPVCNL